MVSVNPNPPAQDFHLDPMKMGLPGVNCLPPSSETATMAADRTVNANSSGVWSAEDANKKVRKPYTITKSRESWTDQEHEKFLEALQLFDRDWKKIEAYVGSKTVIQIRSHAQKYFMKVQKNGTGEHVPPPRPKRKAAHPYPQKASKHAAVVSQITGPPPSSGALLEPGFVLRPESFSLSRNPTCNPSLSSWSSSFVQPVAASHVTKEDEGATRPGAALNCCSSSSNESTPGMWPTSEMNDQEKGVLLKPVRVMPDFAQVYSFIGSVFDPNASDHLKKLKGMDPIDVQTVLLLMKNLTINLVSPEFEDQRRLLSAYATNVDKAKSSSSLYKDLHIPTPGNAIPAV